MSFFIKTRRKETFYSQYSQEYPKRQRGGYSVKFHVICNGTRKHGNQKENTERKIKCFGKYLYQVDYSNENQRAGNGIKHSAPIGAEWKAVPTTPKKPVEI